MIYDNLHNRKLCQLPDLIRNAFGKQYVDSIAYPWTVSFRVVLCKQPQKAYSQLNLQLSDS